MTLRRWLCVCAALLLFVAPTFADEIRVAAASDLQFAMKTLGTQFQQQTGHTLLVSYGSSGNLYSQILNGAPYDLFFSADSDLPRRLTEASLARADTLYQYGRGWLVLWAPKDSGLDPRATHLNALFAPSVQKIAIGNPQHAPYGRAAVAALRKAGIYDRVATKLVYGENISQTAQFVQSGNAQIGILAQSLVLAPAMQDKGLWWELPAHSYPAINQSVVLLRSAQHAEAAKAFLAFLRTPAAQHILEIYGFRR